MERSRLDLFLEYFSKLEDPRVEGRTTYPLDEILFVALCTVICGGEGWADFQLFGEEKIDFFKKIFAF